MALFRKKKDEEDVQTAEHEAVGGDTAETGAVAASAVEPEPSAGDGNGGGSFIPSGGARVESDSAAKPETEASGETADNVQETGERAEERRDDAVEGAPPASARVGDSETPHQAQRRGEGLPEPEDIGGRASAIRQSPPTTHTAPDPAEAPRESPLGAQRAAEQGSDRPEVAVAGAFLAGLVFARLLAWMGGDDDE